MSWSLGSFLRHGDPGKALRWSGQSTSLELQAIPPLSWEEDCGPFLSNVEFPGLSVM